MHRDGVALSRICTLIIYGGFVATAEPWSIRASGRAKRGLSKATNASSDENGYGSFWRDQRVFFGSVRGRSKVVDDPWGPERIPGYGCSKGHSEGYRLRLHRL